MLTVARIIFPKYWKCETIPDLLQWKAIVIYMAEMDKLTKKLRGSCKEKCKEDWAKWAKYCGPDSDFHQFILNLEIY